MRDVPSVPHPEGDLVLVRILEVGVCGTDREVLAAPLEPPPGERGLVLGHEALAEVVECGPAATSLRAGDLVVPMVRIPCPHARCGPCRAGRQDFCVTGDHRERGIRRAHGFMAERALLPEGALVQAPRALRAHAVLCEPLTIAEKGLEVARAVEARLPAPGWAEDGPTGPAAPERRSALVLGAGPMGLLGAMALVARGYRTTVFSREPPGGPRARLAVAFGARYLSGAELPLSRAAGRVEPFDLVYEATGAARPAFDALPLLAPNGAFVLTGVPGHRGPIELPADRLLRDLVLGNRVLVGTVNAGRRHFAAAVRDLAYFRAAWPDALAALVTARFPLERAAEAVERRPGAVKQVVEVAGAA